MKTGVLLIGTIQMILFSFQAVGNLLDPYAGSVPQNFPVNSLQNESAHDGSSARLVQAKELLGKHYKRSVVRKGEDLTTIDDFIFDQTKNLLHGKWKKRSRTIAKTILRESKRYFLDPIFVMAVIENESSFDPDAKGSQGEIGLMQIRPGTARWIADKFELKWHGKKTLHDPKNNIKIGAAYLAYLRTQFDFHGKLYLAAYNMGEVNVHRALGHHVWPKDYASRVMKRYIKLYGELRKSIRESDTDTSNG